MHLRATVAPTDLGFEDCVGEHSPMKTRCVLLVGALGLASVLDQPAVLAECITLRVDEHGIAHEVESYDPPPITVSGTLCGTLRMERIAVVTGFPMNLFDEHDVLVGTALADEKGAFGFSRLVPGRYRLEPPAGFAQSHQVIDITNVGNNACDHPLFVKATVAGECARTVVTTVRPPGF